MKKIAIAGASVALAAMPVVGVFATDLTTHTDTLQLTLAQVCTLGTVTNGVATNTDATTHVGFIDGTNTYAGTWSNDTLSANIVAGVDYTLGQTNFKVRCNDGNGFQLFAKAGQYKTTGDPETYTATLQRKVNNEVVEEIPTGYIPSPTWTSADNSYWDFKFETPQDSGVTIVNAYQSRTAVPAVTTGNGAMVASTSTTGNLNNGQDITVTYGAGVDYTVTAGTYSGTVVYTLVSQ